MKRKFKITLVVFLVIILGCFSNVFAAFNYDDEIEFGTNLNNTADNSAKIGDQLFYPERGWARYARDKYRFDEYRFNFTGTKIRLVFEMGTNYSRNISVKIDGVEVGPFSENGSNRSKILLYENTKLDDKEHYVEITNNDTEQFGMDAIDTYGSGKLKPYNNFLVHNLRLNKDTDLLTAGQADTLTATVTSDDATNKTLTWISSDSSIAAVDSTGKVIALKAGKVTITAKTTDGSNLQASCDVTINKRATSIKLNKDVDHLLVGQTDKLTSLVLPGDATVKDVKWASSNPDVISVDSNGNITALKSGSALIKATVQDGSGLHAQCRITVE